tara:strand:- start:437 stop:2011 length:1575 start_codon:yes stop_codon:yes gene_type:complete
MGSILTTENIETIISQGIAVHTGYTSGDFYDDRPFTVANLGDRNSGLREDWGNVLREVNNYFDDFPDILEATLPEAQRVNSGFSTLKEKIRSNLLAFKSKIRTDNPASTGPEKKLREMVNAVLGGSFRKTEAAYMTTSSIFENLYRGLASPAKHYTIPHQFVFTPHREADPELTEWKAGSAFVVYARLLALHNALFPSSMKPLYGANTRAVISQVEELLENVQAGVNFLRELIEQEVVVQEETATEEAADAGFSIGSLSAPDKRRIVNLPDYKDYFSTTFNAGAITAVPLLYNFYLTAEYFQEINKSFESPKDRALDVIWSIIKNDNNFDNTPDMRRGASEVAIAASSGQDQTSAFNSAARDFILKMLIKTPIDILKGLVELIDPHVAISKVIKTGSGFAFNELARALDGPSEEVNTALSRAIEGSDPDINGEDLVKLVLCLVEQAMAGPLQVARETNSDAVSIPENFFPDISIDGIDFTGTVSGLLMIPPSPLGLLYLLLELIKSSDTNETINVSDVSNAKDC